MHAVVRTLLYAYVCLILLAVGASVAVLKLGHIRVLNVQTGSMAPTFRAGDIVLSKPVQSSALRPGMVVSFMSQQNGPIVSHRVVAVDGAHNQLTTRGDALNKPDTPINQTALVGKVTMIVPRAGFALDFLRHPIGLALFVYLPAFGIVAGEVKALSRHYGRSYYRLPSFR